MVQHRLSEASKRLKSIPGIGLVGATAIAATVPDPKVFRSGRAFAAWIGLGGHGRRSLAIRAQDAHSAVAFG